MQLRNQIEKFILNHNSAMAIKIIESEAKSLASVIHYHNEDGWNLLQLAAREGLNDVAAVLCFAGAKITSMAEVKSDNPEVLANVQKSALNCAEEHGHEVTAKILQAFVMNIDNTTVKALYMWAIKHYDTPVQLNLPDKPSLLACQGLLELAMFLNKPEWAETILSFYENFKCRHNIKIRRPVYWEAYHDQDDSFKCHNANIRTPAYWAAYHNQDELFKKICQNDEELLLLTLWQLKTDGLKEKFHKYFTDDVKEKSITNSSVFQSGFEGISKELRNPYSFASKGNAEFLKPYEQSFPAVHKLALSENNFVALAVLQECYKERRFDFYQTLSLSTESESIHFELISQNISFYNFILILDLKNESQADYILKHVNKIGLIHYLMNVRAVKGKFSRNESDLYTFLSKTDKFLKPIASNVIKARKITDPKMFLFDLGIPWELKENEIKRDTFPNNSVFNSVIRHKEILKQAKVFGVFAFPDRFVKHILNFLIEDDPELKTINKRVHGALTGVDFSDQKSALDKTTKIVKKMKDTGDLIVRLKAEVKQLNDFKNQLQDEVKHRVKRKNRCCFAASFAGFLGIPGLFAGNVIFLNNLVNKKAELVSALKNIFAFVSYQHNYNCQDFNEGHPFGCKSSYSVTNLDNYQLPDVCTKLCDDSYWTDVWVAVSTTTSFILAITFLWKWVGICCDCRNEAKCSDSIFHNLEDSYKGKWYSEPYALTNTSIIDYSHSLQQQVGSVSGLLENPINDDTLTNEALERVNTAILDKDHALEQHEDKYNNNTVRRRLHNSYQNLFHAPEERKRSHSEIIIDMEPPVVSNVCSLNDLRQPLLGGNDNESTPRKSACPCSIL